jgi:hypothetical protein
MNAFLTTWWQQVTGYNMAVRTAYSKGYNRGFLEGLAVSNRAVRGVGYLDGFQEGRESVRTIPLDSSVADTVDDDDDGGWPCSQ